MENMLENLCEERGIKVEFISHKFIDDASESKNNKPVIKVHKIFKQCPIKVAAAVVEIFTGEGYTSDCIEIIERYLVEKYGSVGIRIQPPKVIKTEPVNKPMSNASNGKEDNSHGKENQYIEADISSIDATNLRSQHKKLNDNEIIMPKEQEILELDIVVAPPTT